MIGSQVGKYRITQEIGDGGHAFVFKGEGPNGEQVAIKMLKPSIADEDNLEKRFLLEADALKKLSHPQIVRFEDYIYQNGYHYLVLEYMDQGSVEDLIKTMGPVAHRYAIPIFYKVLDAIEYSHQHGYIHRDMKPNNILINSEGEAKLTDFGITKVVGGQNLTKKGYVLGTTLYMAPEFISQGVVSVKTDIYALGVTFYEMLTTRKPFEFTRENEPLVSFARRVCQGEPTLPSTYRPIPPELERILMKSLAQDPKARYKSAKEFMKDLAKSFPDLVQRDIVIPSGRAMTRYVKVDELQNVAGTVDSPPKSKGFPKGTRLAIGATTAAVIMLLALFMPSIAPGMAASLGTGLLYGGGAVLGVLLGYLLYAFLPKPEVLPGFGGGDLRPASTVGDENEEFLEESSIPEFEDAGDTIPFHEGFQPGEAFEMTDVSELEAYLVVVGGPDKGRRFGLRPVSRIGRDLRLDIRPHDKEISRHHAVLTFTGTGFCLEDLGSTNGTYVNEEKVVGKRHLKPGDIVRVGASRMRFEYQAQSAPTA